MARFIGFPSAEPSPLIPTVPSPNERNEEISPDSDASLVAVEGLRQSFAPRRVLRVLLVATVLLTTAGIAGELTRAFSDGDQSSLVRFLRVLRRNFAPSGEQTIGAWFTASALLGCGLLLLAIAEMTRAATGRYVAHWRGLGAIFVFLSCDETVSIHEQLGDWVGDRLPTGGMLLWAWVIPYGLFACAVAAAYLPFLRRLPRPTRHLFISSAALYTGGALVIEMIEAGITDARGHGGGPVTVLAVAEETAEMLGAVVFLYALLSYRVRSEPVRRSER